MPFQVVVVTPEQQAVDATVSQAILPAHDGQLGVLTGRAPLLVKLGAGVLRLDVQGGPRQLYFVEGGIAQVKDNQLTVLTNEAVPTSQIDLITARAELAEATARVPTDESTRKDRDRRIARARAMQLAAEAR